MYTHGNISPLVLHLRLFHISCVWSVSFVSSFLDISLMKELYSYSKVRVGSLFVVAASRLLKMRNLFTKIRPEDKTTTFLDLILKVLHVLGMFRLPPRDSTTQRKTTGFYKLYMTFVFTFYALSIVLNILCVIFHASQSFGEFLVKSMETLGVIFIFLEIILLNKKAEVILRILSLVKKFEFIGREKVFYISRRLEQFTSILFLVMILCSCIPRYMSPLLSISESEEEILKKTYALKNPQYRLPLCLWLPCVDTSEPVVFRILYLVEMYLGLYWIALGFVAASFFPFIFLHLCGQHFVLSSRLKLLGRPTVYFPRGARYSRSYCDRLRQQYEIKQMKRCILFHQKLVSFRTLVSLFANQVDSSIILNELSTFYHEEKNTIFIYLWRIYVFVGYTYL